MAQLPLHRMVQRRRAGCGQQQRACSKPCVFVARGQPLSLGGRFRSEAFFSSADVAEARNALHCRPKSTLRDGRPIGRDSDRNYKRSTVGRVGARSVTCPSARPCVAHCFAWPFRRQLVAMLGVRSWSSALALVANVHACLYPVWSKSPLMRGSARPLGTLVFAFGARSGVCVGQAGRKPLGRCGMPSLRCGAAWPGLARMAFS